MIASEISKRALILGANGQDGTILSNILLNSGYSVLGIGRSKGEECRSDKHSFKVMDIRESKLLTTELKEFKPSLIFHVAAIHGSAGIQYEEIWDEAVMVNTVSVHTSLEYMRLNDPKCRLIYASSSKVFGNKLPKTINEQTSKKQDCLYSITKNASYDLIEYYRKTYALKASVVYLFNHESEYRKESYFIPTILEALISAIEGSKRKFNIRSLGFYCDWGSAEEYMSIMINIIEKAPSEDFVLGTGKCFYARDLVNELFSKYGLDYNDYLNEIDKRDQNSSYHVETNKLQRKLGIVPKLDIMDVCTDMLKKRNCG